MIKWICKEYLRKFKILLYFYYLTFSVFIGCYCECDTGALGLDIKPRDLEHKED
jgi:hypothetical protein